jgi:hypothetical protein
MVSHSIISFSATIVIGEVVNVLQQQDGEADLAELKLSTPSTKTKSLSVGGALTDDGRGA